MHARFLDRLANFDWSGLRDTLADDFTWDGPFGDHLDDPDAYAALLETRMSQLRDYRIDTVRTIGSGDGCAVELVQRFDDNGAARAIAQVMVFDLDPATGRIAHLGVYWRGAPS